jgi:hypothetical protein
MLLKITDSVTLDNSDNGVTAQTETTNVSVVNINKNEETCPICFDVLTQNKNVCSTPCGHTFCFGCIIKHLNNGTACPYCRTEINEKPQINTNNTGFFEDDNSEDYFLDDEDDSQDDDEEESEDEFDEDPNAVIDLENSEDDDEGCCVERIEHIFKENNISYLDVLSALIGRFPKNTNRRSRRMTEKTIYDIVNGLDEENSAEKSELKKMRLEDVCAIV